MATMFASISASSSTPSGRDTGSRSHALRAESSLADTPWTRPKSPGKEIVHGAIPLQQAVQGAPAQGQARGQGGSQARAAREGGGGVRRRGGAGRFRPVKPLRRTSLSCERPSTVGTQHRPRGGRTSVNLG